MNRPKTFLAVMYCIARSRHFIFPVLALLCSLGLSAHAQPTLPRGHPKFKTAQKVFDDLIHAIGDGRTRPHLRVQPNGVTGQLQVAWFVPGSNVLTLEERVYDLFVSMGADSLDALAVLLGHELAHYYKDHGWVGDFGNAFADLEVGQELEKLERSAVRMLETEFEADYYSGFFGYMAGYNTLGIAPKMLEQIYAAYELDEHLAGYPSLFERQAIARRSREQLDQMIPVFEAGRGLLLLGRYESAGRCFDYIARTFPSREIFNNAGVTRALEALGLFEAGKVDFAYPFELDAQTRLRGPRAKAGIFGETPAERRDRLLAEARTHFENAGKKDPQYATAYTNLACVADLQGKYDEAMVWAQRALEIAEKRAEAVSLAHARIARGIARAHRNPADEAGARRDFATARQGARSLAQLNLAVLSPEVADRAGAELSKKGGGRPSREQIDGQTARGLDAAIIPDVISRVPRIDQNQPEITIYAQQTPAWEGLFIDMGYRTTALLTAREAYSGQSGRGLGIGSDLAQVLEAHGPPTYVTPGRQGAYFVYAHAEVIFQINAENKVQKWMIYHVEE